MQCPDRLRIRQREMIPSTHVRRRHVAFVRRSYGLDRQAFLTVFCQLKPLGRLADDLNP